MFSPTQNNTGNGASSGPTTRGRRRQRPTSSDSLAQQPKAKRQRLPLTEQTFVNPDNSTETFEVKSTKQSMIEAKQDGVETVPTPTPAPLPPKKELSVRSKKAKSGERLSKGDGSVVLTSNNAFVVSKLAALPDRIRLDATSRQHGLVDTSTGYALNLTHTHAVIWPYSAPTPSPESFTFTLPYPSKHSSDPLPLGLLVSPSASSSEPGLVVVMPTSGKITYWESISSATTLDFMRQQRNGVEDSISGMYSGETVIQIINAETAAGFVLAFSSGRLAYMSVRDPHGRPQISVQFLRTSLGPSSAGFFGSIRNVLSQASNQGDIAAVRSEKTPKQGERTIVAATSKGKLHAWRIHRGGHHDLVSEIDSRDTIIKAILNTDQVASKYPSDSLAVVDFAFVPKDREDKYIEMSQLAKPPASDDAHHLLLLTRLSSRQSSRYYLVEVVLPSGTAPDATATTGLVRPISSYSTPTESHALTKPRLYLPRPAVLAFLVFNRAVVVASIAQPPDSPDSQLMEDNHILPSTYEDVVDLRAESSLEIIGSGVEEPQLSSTSEEVRLHRTKVKNPCAVLLVRGAGTLRITTTDIERFASEKPPTITAKSKLEQAVFFGIKQDNPLIFDARHDLPFSSKEVSEAAIQLSDDILASNSPYLSTGTAHLEMNMDVRLRALEQLVSHLRSLKVALDRKTKWKLLWNAEKLHVALLIWRRHESFIASRPADSKKSLIAEMVEYIRKEEKTAPNPAKGEVDELRHWFLYDASRMDTFIAWAYEVIKQNSIHGVTGPPLGRFIYEALDINNAASRDAYEFRRANLGLYSLQDEKLENGILSGDYEGLPQPWTCNRFLVNNLKRLVELASEWVKHNWSPDPDQAAKDEGHMVHQIRDLSAPATEVYLTEVQEFSRWALVSNEPDMIAEGQRFKGIYERDRHDKVILLAQAENWDEAIKIAEHHNSLSTLAQVLTMEIHSYYERLSLAGVAPKEYSQLEAKIASKKVKTDECIERYGENFAFPLYEYLLEVLGVDAVLGYPEKEYKTAFLRTKPELAKVSWINDVMGEEDIEHAANTLLNIGLAREQQVWNKKIELSLGKLARMAEAESRPSSKASTALHIRQSDPEAVVADTRVTAIDNQLAIIKIQDQLYNQFRPVVRAALDETEELNMAREAFTPKLPKKYKILNELFEDGISRLLKHEALDPHTLIDLLTMITLPPESKELMPEQFYLALRVANYGLNGDERFQAERLIWRRCYLREDWTKINNTCLKTDVDVVELLASTDVFDLFCAVIADRGAKDGNALRQMLPSEAMGVYTEVLDPRLEAMDKGYREKMFEAMRWEDSNIRKHIDKHQLEKWAKDAKKYAADAVREQFDTKTAEGAASGLGTSRNAANGQNGTH